MHCLVVDDDPKFRSYVSSGLEQSEIRCTTAADGGAALALLSEPGHAHVDLILLDLMTPVKNGWELLHDLHDRSNETAVIFVTAREAIAERARGLQLGADDYIIKPFAFEELLARIGAVVYRRQTLTPLVYADLALDMARRLARRGQQTIDLAPREFDVLRVLVQNAERVVTRQKLLDEAWGIDIDPETNLVDVHVERLRKKLDHHGQPLIQTVRGEGYRLSSTMPGAVDATP